MGILIGMDEAGYGPNFGPLVVAATAWEVGEEGSGFRHGESSIGVQGSGDGENDGFRISDFGLRIGTSKSQFAIGNRQSAIGFPEIDLYRLLRNIVAKSASERRIAIADSKVLYHPGLGLRQLERGVHAVLAAIERSAACWSTIVDVCGADPDGRHRSLAWHDGFNCTLPIDAARDELDRLGARFVRACDGAGVRPLAIRARLVFPSQFNEMMEYYGTKGAALSHVTVGLLREVMNAVGAAPDEKGTGPGAFESSDARRGNLVGASPLFAVCDKHGGRNFYAALLQHHFSEHWIEPTFESHRESRYEWGPAESRVRVAFRMNGESFLPTALASMTAKYLRELAMRAFNEFWCARVPGLRPTAGYPVDARRYKAEIGDVQRALGIDDHVLWRSR